MSKRKKHMYTLTLSVKMKKAELGWNWDASDYYI